MQVVALIGAPGAGKGTQGMLLSDHLNLYYSETSGILEEYFESAKPGDTIAVDGVDYDIDTEINNWKTGILVTPQVATHLVMEKMRLLHKEGKGVLLSGSPRTLYEVEHVLPLSKELYGVDNVTFIELSIKPETTVFRNSHRRICELFRHPVLYNEETKDLTACPLDGSNLLKREGLDDPETIKVRLDQYKNRTEPLLTYVREHGYPVHTISADGTVEEVYKAVTALFEK